MIFWKRAIATLIVMLMASILAGLVWHSLFDARIPSYLSGMLGGIVGLIVWEFLRGSDSESS